MEEGVNFLTFYKEIFRLKQADAGTYSPLVLAYIGDAVYELMIRTKIVNDGNMQVNKLHRKSSSLVKEMCIRDRYCIPEAERFSTDSMQGVWSMCCWESGS